MVRRQFMLTLSIHLVGLNGLFIVFTTMLNQLAFHRQTGAVYTNILFGITLVYIWSLLRRHKRNAWLAAMGVYVFGLGFNAALISMRLARDDDISLEIIRSLIIPLCVAVPLYIFRASFNVRSDIRGFGQAVRVSAVLLTITFIYGVTGFSLLDTHDFHEEMSLPTAVHRTIDQFDLTTNHQLKPHTKRAVVFMNSLSVISVVSIGYVIIAFFQPLRARHTHTKQLFDEAEALLARNSGRSEDFFKLWPHDKNYLFSNARQACLAYKVQKGVAIVVGDPFGSRKQADNVMRRYEELCYTNDWLPAFVHTETSWSSFYSQHGYNIQLIGQEAVVNVEQFVTQVNREKYFRQISNKFTKQLYTTELLMPPHNSAIVNRLREVSDDWLRQPGRAERGFMLGYFSEAYLQQGAIMVARDGAGSIMAFLNQIPSYDEHEANFDMLRHAKGSLGNINDFLLTAFLHNLHTQGVARLNLGLCPLAGIDESEDNSVITTAMRFMYSNGNRFYSFRGLYRFKAKYQPEWSDRFVAYKGGVRGFTRTMRALSVAMKIK